MNGQACLGNQSQKSLADRGFRLRCPYIVAALQARLKDELHLTLTSQRSGWLGHERIHPLEITDPVAVDGLIAETRPTHVIHLAAISDLPSAAADPNLAWSVNVIGTLNLARSTLRYSRDSAFIFAGSSLAYGGTPDHGGRLREDDPFRPTSEYAATKASADLALGMLAHQGLHAIRLRLFNHTGLVRPTASSFPPSCPRSCASNAVSSPGDEGREP